MIEIILLCYYYNYISRYIIVLYFNFIFNYKKINKSNLTFNTILHILTRTPDFYGDFTARTPDFYGDFTESTPDVKAGTPPPCQIKKNGYAEITKDFLFESEDKSQQKLYKAGLIGFVKAFDGDTVILKFKDNTFTIIDKEYVCNVEKPKDWDTK